METFCQHCHPLPWLSPALPSHPRSHEGTRGGNQDSLTPFQPSYWQTAQPWINKSLDCLLSVLFVQRGIAGSEEWEQTGILLLGMQSWGWGLHHPPPRAAQAAGQASQRWRTKENQKHRNQWAKGRAESNRKNSAALLPHSGINNSICSRPGSLCHFTKQRKSLFNASTRCPWNRTESTSEAAQGLENRSTTIVLEVTF